MNFKPGCVMAFCVLAFVSGVASEAEEKSIQRSKKYNLISRLFCQRCEAIELLGDGKRQVIPFTLASEILSIKLINEYSDCCKEKINFGKDGPTIYVDGECQGLFLICYREGVVKHRTCSSINFETEICHTNCAKVQSLAVKDQLSKSPCISGKTFFPSGSDIVVKDGCRAKFFVGCNHCDFHDHW